MGFYGQHRCSPSIPIPLWPTLPCLACLAAAPLLLPMTPLLLTSCFFCVPLQSNATAGGLLQHRPSSVSFNTHDTYPEPNTPPHTPNTQQHLSAVAAVPPPVCPPLPLHRDQHAAGAPRVAVLVQVDSLQVRYTRGTGQGATGTGIRAGRAEEAAGCQRSIRVACRQRCASPGACPQRQPAAAAPPPTHPPTHTHLPGPERQAALLQGEAQAHAHERGLQRGGKNGGGHGQGR